MCANMSVSIYKAVRMYILRHHPVLSPRCGPHHYITLCFCVCRGWPHVCELFIASLHTLGMAANGEAPLFITHLGHTKIFFFFLLLPSQGFFSRPPSGPSCILLPERTQKKRFGPVHIMSDQLMFGSVLLQYVQVLNTFFFFFCILFSFPAYSVM